MKTITFQQKNSISGEKTIILDSFTIDAEKVNITESVEIPVQFNLYERLSDWADKNNLKIY